MAGQGRGSLHPLLALSWGDVSVAFQPIPSVVFHLLHGGSSQGGCGGVKHPPKPLLSLLPFSGIPHSPNQVEFCMGRILLVHCGVRGVQLLPWSSSLMSLQKAPNPPQTAVPG